MESLGKRLDSVRLSEYTVNSDSPTEENDGLYFSERSRRALGNFRTMGAEALRRTKNTKCAAFRSIVDDTPKCTAAV